MVMLVYQRVPTMVLKQQQRASHTMGYPRDAIGGLIMRLARNIRRPYDAIRRRMCGGVGWEFLG